MLEFRVKYAKQVNDESQKLQSLIKTDAKYESILGQLESFVGRLVGGSATSTPPSDSAVRLHDHSCVTSNAHTGMIATDTHCYVLPH